MPKLPRFALAASLSFLLACLLPTPDAAFSQEPAAAPLQWPAGYFNARTATDPAKPQPASRPGELRLARTHHSIAIEWELEGDTNHNAACSVEYKRADEASWHQALPLLRVDYLGWYGDKAAERSFNMLAGSILFVRPGAEYEVRLRMTDPDGAAAAEEVRRIWTRPLPALPQEARRWHVRPAAEGTSNGDGSEKNPFRGLPAALSAAHAGDVLLLHAGEYGAVTIERSGAAGSDHGARDDTRYLALRAAGDGPAVVSTLRLSGSYLWLEGLSFQKKDDTTALRDTGASAHVVVRGCTFRDYHYSIQLSPQSRGWYIADNDIVGDTTKGISGEGVELSHSSDHTVCNNRITRSADGISYPGTNCDLFGNDIFAMSDDPIEPDYGYANNRIWGNRLQGHTGISFQPMYCGPWYIVRNHIVSDFIFKLRVQDRFVIVNNTLIGHGTPLAHAHGLLSAYSRNNVWMHLGGSEFLWLSQAPDSEKFRSYVIHNTIFESPVATWKSDLDYDGFEYSAAKVNPKLKTPNPFMWMDRRFTDVAAMSRALGIEAHGQVLEKARDFLPFEVSADVTTAQAPLLQLSPQSHARDAGVPVPNLSEDFIGAAPDLGALELDRPLPAFGPRAEPDAPAARNAWVLQHQR